jgi:alkaline phosphatase D
MLWARYDGLEALEVVVWPIGGGPILAQRPALPAGGGFVHAVIDGLAAGTRYRYAFLEGGRARSPIGRFRAAIAEDSLESVTFGATSCTDNSRPFDTLARAAEADLDAFIFTGDIAYCEDCQTLEDYRSYWVLHTQKEEHRRLRASTSLLATWDDHEVANDWDPERIDSARVAAARQAFFENLPLSRAPEDPDRIWRSARWGRTVEVFVLDSRSERQPSTRRTPGAIYLSPAQLDWLKTGLRNSPAVFKVIVNSVPITAMPSVWDFYPRDRWEGYAAQREEILRFIEEEAIPGVLWIAGDFHLSFIATISAAGIGQSLYEVLVGPGAQSSNPLVGSLNPPQFEWASGENNYTQLRFDPTSRTISVLHIGADGSVVHSRTFVFPE